MLSHARAALAHRGCGGRPRRVVEWARRVGRTQVEHLAERKALFVTSFQFIEDSVLVILHAPKRQIVMTTDECNFLPRINAAPHLPSAALGLEPSMVGLFKGGEYAFSRLMGVIDAP